MTFHFFALAAIGEGLSGGDRIFIELARRWSVWGHTIHIYTTSVGEKVISAQNLSHPQIQLHIIPLSFWPRLGFLVTYVVRIIAGVGLGFTLPPANFFYSCSDFWMDVLPALILKCRQPKNVWFAGWFQTAPHPFTARSSHPFLYWLSQFLIKPVISALADFVLVNNHSEIRQFPLKSIPVLGAVDTAKINSYLINHPAKIKPYSAVFQGRFHPQKGVLELVDIWSKVIKKIPRVKLAMIGDGELMPVVQAKIKKLNLEENIKLFGYVYDGPAKYRIFSQSQIVVHPSLYDSGGMAAAEAMAFGLSAVGFDLPAYQSYYPRGMIKVPLGDLSAFADAIIYLLTRSSARRQLGQTARKWVSASCSWDTRAREVLASVTA